MSYISPNKNTIEESGDFITYNELPGKTAGSGGANSSDTPFEFQFVVVVPSDFEVTENMEFFIINDTLVKGFKPIDEGAYGRRVTVKHGDFFSALAPDGLRLVEVNGIWEEIPYFRNGEQLFADVIAREQLLNLMWDGDGDPEIFAFYERRIG